MTESSDLSRSGLDMPEGSANADKVDETGLVDTNADGARNPVDSGDGGGDGGDGGQTPPPETPDESPEHQPAQQQVPEPAPQQ
jgi:hypothetical protein